MKSIVWPKDTTKLYCKVYCFPAFFFLTSFFCTCLCKTIAKEEGGTSSGPIEKSLPQGFLSFIASGGRDEKMMRDSPIIVSESFALEGYVYEEMMVGAITLASS